MSIAVKIDGASVVVERDVFTALFDNSVVSEYSAYRKALTTGTMPLRDLVDLARKADIPYVLFFAPPEVVEAQLRRKTDILMRGVSKDVFSMNSRSRVRLSDVELIIKDLIRKQESLKRLDKTLVQNTVVGCIKKSLRNPVEDANTLRTALGFKVSELRATTSKQAAFDMLVSRFEAKQILVSQSQRNFMPQQVPRRAKFSGMCVRDKKIPYIFLSGADDGPNYEPVGRKLFTLALLGVLVAMRKFVAVTYDEHTADLISEYEYEVTEELLMPATDVATLDVRTLDEAKIAADMCRVTPSAFVMRARRLRLISGEDSRYYLNLLRKEFAAVPKPKSRSPKPVNAVRRYNGVEFSQRMVQQLDHGAISAGDFCRVVALNKLKRSQIAEFKAGL